MLTAVRTVVQRLLCLLSNSSSSSSISLSLVLALTLSSCSIEPPLHLPGQSLIVDRQAVETQVEAIWENPNWEGEFLPGWEAADEKTYGPIYYETPEDYELRLYYLGEDADAPHTRVTSAIMHGNSFRSLFNYGYHDILVWSNIHTPDNSQSVLIEESPQVVNASVTRNNSAALLSLALQKHMPAFEATIYNMPEIFFSAYLQNLQVTPNPEDYDYYDEKNQCWVKKVNMPGCPLVYIYLVQVVLRNNRGRITGVNSGAALSGVTDSTNVNYGNSSFHSSSLVFDMGLKRNKTVTAEYCQPHHSTFLSKCTPGEIVDVLSGRVTTYGLCGQQSYLQEKSSLYKGSRPDNKNFIAVDFSFKNGRDSVITFPVTEQMQHTCHGGVVTIEVNVDDIPIPVNPNPQPSGGSGFDPYVEEYKDTTVYEFGM